MTPTDTTTTPSDLLRIAFDAGHGQLERACASGVRSSAQPLCGRAGRSSLKPAPPGETKMPGPSPRARTRAIIPNDRDDVASGDDQMPSHAHPALP
jgi:hypothetical protein